MEDKKLYKSDNKIISGVSSGFAEYFNLDPTIMRLLFIFLTLISGGLFIFVYAAAWIMVPDNPRNNQADYTIE